MKSLRTPQKLCGHKYQKIISKEYTDFLVCYNCGKVEKGKLIREIKGSLTK